MHSARFERLLKEGYLVEDVERKLSKMACFVLEKSSLFSIKVVHSTIAGGPSFIMGYDDLRDVLRDFFADSKVIKNDAIFGHFCIAKTSLGVRSSWESNPRPPQLTQTMVTQTPSGGLLDHSGVKPSALDTSKHYTNPYPRSSQGKKSDSIP